MFLLFRPIICSMRPSVCPPTCLSVQHDYTETWLHMTETDSLKLPILAAPPQKHQGRLQHSPSVAGFFGGTSLKSTSLSSPADRSVCKSVQSALSCVGWP